MSIAQPGDDYVDPSALATEGPAMQEGLQELSSILHRNGFTETSPIPGMLVLSRVPHERVTLRVNGASIDIFTQDNDDTKPTGDRTFHDEVMGIIARESDAFPSQQESQFMGGKIRRLLGWLKG